MEAKYRPSHADATYDAKYGVRVVVCSHIQSIIVLDAVSIHAFIGWRRPLLCQRDHRTCGSRGDREEDSMAVLSSGSHRLRTKRARYRI